MLRYGTSEEAGLRADKIKYLENLVKSWAAEGKSQAFAYLVARNNIIVSHNAEGYLKPEKNSPLADVSTLFPMASISKPITSTVAMIMVEAGKLVLSCPVSEYIPEFTGENKNKVLVHHLMTHTSGLRDEDIYKHSQTKRNTAVIPPHESTQDPDLNERLFLGYDTNLWKLPGEEMSYCGYGIELLGEIIRRVSGMSLDQYARENLFEPLGMTDTYYSVPESVWNRVIVRADDVPGGRWFSSGEALKRPSAAGGVYSTVYDMAKLGSALLNNGKYGTVRILSEASVKEMTRNQILDVSSRFGDEYFPEASFGYGWSINSNKKDNNDLFSPQTFCHGGGGGVCLCVDPVYKIVSAVFSVEKSINDGKHFWYPYRYLFNNVVASAIE
jgi:serine-type D-Ala-D-Ala carboxypeptidase